MRRRGVFNERIFFASLRLCPATDKQEPTCWSQRRKPLGSLMVAKHLFPSAVWEKACSAIRQNRHKPRRFSVAHVFPSSPRDGGVGRGSRRGVIPASCRKRASPRPSPGHGGE